MTRPTIAADTVRLRANPDHVNRIVESASIYARGLGATPETLVFAGLSLALESLPPGKLRGVLELAQWIAQRRADWELSAKGELWTSRAMWRRGMRTNERQRRVSYDQGRV